MPVNNENDVACSFCGKPQMMAGQLIAGAGVYICDSCVRLCMSIISDEDRLRHANRVGERDGSVLLPKPVEIKSKLDEYVIGQDEAKIALSVAVYNHYKRIYFTGDDGVELSKSNVLLLGPTGVGKTYLAQTLAKLLDVPFAIADATTLTEAGYVGDDVENILLRLIQAADYDIFRAERGIIYIDELARISGGAFDGLEKVVQKRIASGSLGFGGEVHGKRELDERNWMRDVTPHDLVKYGLIPELVGRIPVISSLEALDEKALVRILKEPKNSLIQQYKKLFDLDRVDLEFTDDALVAVAKKTLERKTGARGLRAILEDLLMPIMYQVPSDYTVEKVVITKDMVENNSGPEIVYNKERKPMKIRITTPKRKERRDSAS